MLRFLRMEAQRDRVRFRNLRRRSSGFVCLILVVQGCFGY